MKNLPERLLELCVQAFCRLVEKQNIWVQEQNLCQRCALLLSAGEIIGMLV